MADKDVLLPHKNIPNVRSIIKNYALAPLGAAPRPTEVRRYAHIPRPKSELQLPPESQPRFSQDVVKTILEKANPHRVARIHTRWMMRT